VSGNAYALLALYRLTQDKKYLRRAHRFAEFMSSSDFSEVALRPDHPYSLFEGLGGAACLYADLVKPEQSSFPMFEL
jgi:Lanthionine synthetase C-like protein